MKVINLFTAFFILFFVSTISLAQNIVEDENWLKGFNTEADSLPTLVYWDFHGFSLKDIPQAKQKLNVVRGFSPQNEGEGLYYAETAIGDKKLVWNKQCGFFNFYFYHTLKNFDYGTIEDFPGFINLDYEKRSYLQKGKKKALKYKMVKVKVGEKHYLVPANRLRDFCERAAGLSVDLSDFYYYWTKEEDMKKSGFGLPVLPAEYKEFLRYPVQSEIVRVGKRVIIPNEQTTKENNFDDIQYQVTINAGRNKNLKKGMNFFAEELGEWIRLTRVSQTTAVGFIARDFDDNNNEQCRDGEGGNGQLTLCKEIKIGMNVITKGDF